MKNEPLDYCRVKKIFDKGFGFLKSLHYHEPVFFHFNNVKDPVAKEKLEKMKRGEVYFYFTSILYKGRRRVYKLWLDLSDVDPNLVPQFSERITDEFINGNTNPFEISYVIKNLRAHNFLSHTNFVKIVSSNKMIKTPSLLKAILIENEAEKNSAVEILIDKLYNKELIKTDWLEEVIILLQKKN